jgi:toxin ParE1/3/4
VNRLLLHPKIEDDLLEIWSFIAADNPEAAERVVSAAYRTFEMLAQNPKLGSRARLKKETVPETRQFVVTDFPTYMAYYRVLDDGVEILRVVHGARNIDSLFESDQRR